MKPRKNPFAPLVLYALGVTAILLVLTARSWSQSEGEVTTVESGSHLAWRHDGLDVDGNSEDLASFRIDVYRSGVVGIHKSVAVKATECSVSDGTYDCGRSVEDLLSGEPGGTYELYVTAVDSAGNESERSEKVSVEWDGTRPRAVLDLRIEIRAVIEGSSP